MQHLLNCWAGSLFQSMAPYMSGTWVGAAKAELSQTSRLHPMKLPCLSRASMAMVPYTLN